MTKENDNVQLPGGDPAWAAMQLKQGYAALKADVERLNRNCDMYRRHARDYRVAMVEAKAEVGRLRNRCDQALDEVLAAAIEPDEYDTHIKRAAVHLRWREALVERQACTPED
jgi:hypothetical protein